MSPVHVIVGDDPRAEVMWANAFAGVVDLYRFDRNVEAFERLTAAEAPVDLVIITPAQRGPFNLTPEQFVSRVLDGALSTSPFLANLHVVVVGTALRTSHPRAMAVTTLDAAIRLVKHGEIEEEAILRPTETAAPAPTVPAAQPQRMSPRPSSPSAHVPSAAPMSSRPDSGSSIRPYGGSFSSSVISHFWGGDDAEDVHGGGSASHAAPAAVHQELHVQQPAQPEPVVETPAPQQQGARRVMERVVAEVRADAAASQEDTGIAAPSFLPTEVSSSEGSAPSLFAQPPSNAPRSGTSGGGAAAPAHPVASSMPPAEALEPAVPYQLPHGAGYRGPAQRGNHPSIIAAAGQPVPPALTAQVQSIVYGNSGAADPLLAWSGSANGALASNVAQPPMQPAAPMPTAPMNSGPMLPMNGIPGAQQMPPRMPAVPMEPPSGSYGSPASGQQSMPQAMSPAAQADPFLQRAEQRGGDVSFG